MVLLELFWRSFNQRKSLASSVKDGSGLVGWLCKQLVARWVNIPPVSVVLGTGADTLHASEVSLT